MLMTITPFFRLLILFIVVQQQITRSVARVNGVGGRSGQSRWEEAGETPPQQPTKQRTRDADTRYRAHRNTHTHTRAHAKLQERLAPKV